MDELFASDDDEEEYEEEEESHVAEVAEDDDDDFIPYFVTIIDSFLGELPEDEVSAFTQSEGFEVYRFVASDPEAPQMMIELNSSQLLIPYLVECLMMQF